MDYGDGSDGSLNVTSLNTVVNDYTYLTGDEPAGESVISVNDSSSFSAGDEILITQVQNGSSEGSNAGDYEFAEIVSINSNDLILKKSLKNQYDYNNPNCTGC